MLVMSGGASLDEIDGDSVTVVEDDDHVTMQLTSPVRGMHILEDVHADRDSGIVNSGPENATSTTGVGNWFVSSFVNTFCLHAHVHVKRHTADSCFLLAFISAVQHNLLLDP